MYYKEIRYIILIIIILVHPIIKIYALRLQMKPHLEETNTKIYNFKSNFNNVFENGNMDSKDKNNRRILDINNNEKILLNKELSKSHSQEKNIINKFTSIGDELYDFFDENTDDKIIKIENMNYPFEIYSNNEGLNDDFYTDFLIKNSYKNLDGDYKNPIALIYRRDVPSNIRNLENSSLYPLVLTKDLEISLNPSEASYTEGRGILANVAQKLNTSTLDLAEKLTKSENLKNNDQFGYMIQSYLKSKAAPSASNTAVNKALDIEQPAINLSLTSNQQLISNREYLENQDATTTNLTEILERVLEKIENIHDRTNNDHDDHPDGAPCDIIGSWSSTTLGLCFDIQLQEDKMRYISPTEINNKILTINIMECTPAKHHQLIDLDWKFAGSALKQWGGPFYIYGQKRNEKVITTFVGFCRTCGGIETIFGSWNFLLPTKDCNDISLAFEVKGDVLRRVRMEMKRRERFKNFLYQNHVVKT